eukprot:55063-Eustigmatos_ZCMA.PRE.2
MLTTTFLSTAGPAPHNMQPTSTTPPVHNHSYSTPRVTTTAMSHANNAYKPMLDDGGHGDGGA